MAKSILVALLLAVATSGPLRAHDFWIEPETFRPEVASTLSAHTLVGQAFRGDALGRNEQHIQRFVLAGPSGESPFLGVAGDNPAGSVRVPAAGLYVIGYESRPLSVDLDPGKLRAYVAEEGLEPFFRAGTSGPIRDHFSRCAKALILAGDAVARQGYDRRLGCALELVPEANPYALGEEGSLPLQLLLAGSPLEGALVVAMESEQPEEGVAARTDAHGRVRLELSGPGVWLVKSVYMAPVPGKDAEWASYWASLTFEVPVEVN